MKSNPENFASFVDADGGEWIKIKSGQYRDTIWRPVDMSLEDDKLNFEVEFLTPPISDKAFQKMAGSIIYSILEEEMNIG